MRRVDEAEARIAVLSIEQNRGSQTTQTDQKLGHVWRNPCHMTILATDTPQHGADYGRANDGRHDGWAPIPGGFDQVLVHTFICMKTQENWIPSWLAVLDRWIGTLRL